MMESREEQRGIVKFRMMQISYWCFYGAFCAFAIAYFTACGMDAKQVGVLASGFTAGALIGQWVFGWFCDKLHTIRRVFVAVGVLSYLAVVAIFTAPKTMPVIAPLYFLLGFLQSPLPTMLDAWILNTYPTQPQRYGEIRAWGSLGYAVFMMFFGSVIQHFGYGVSLVVAGILMGSLLVLACRMPDRAVQTARGTASGEQSLWKNGPFLFVILVGFLIGLASSPLMQFNALYFNAVGGTLSHQGIALCTSAFLQVPIMLSARRMVHIPVRIRLMISAGMYVLCCVLIATARTPLQIILANVFQGVGYGLWLPTLREAVFSTAPRSMASTAQGICDAVTVAVAGIVSSLIAGNLIDSMGIAPFMLVCIATQLVTILLLALRKNYGGTQ